MKKAKTNGQTEKVFKSDARAPEKTIIFLVAYDHNLP